VPCKSGLFVVGWIAGQRESAEANAGIKAPLFDPLLPFTFPLRGPFWLVPGGRYHCYHVAQLLVRDIEGEVVRELKVRAARHGRSAEEEHRQILREALGPKGPAQSLKELLLSMPDVGEDRDFERPEDHGRPVEL
jgi:antitoxin FitA